MVDVVERQEKLPASDEVIEVAPGVLRLQLPIALPGLGHVNCYAIEDDRGYALVDPGLPDPSSYDTLVARLAQIGATPDNVHTVVVTHSHPDHFGGAGRLRLTTGCEVVAHSSFRTIFDPLDDDSAELLDLRAPVVDEDGFDPADFGRYLLGDEEIPDVPGRHTPWGGELAFLTKDEIVHMRAWDDLTKQGFLSPQPTTRLADAQVIRLGRREWVAVHTPGHTADHLCLFDPAGGVLLAGDHVLPTITPHISGLSESPDTLADFFAALEKVADLPGVTNVLPAHGQPFVDLRSRVDDIARHHEERLSTIIEIAGGLGEANVTEFSHQLFRPRSWGAMAESETYAHLEHLRLAGKARTRRQDGQLLYTLVQP